MALRRQSGCEGNIAMLFALFLIPLVFMSGMALDFARGSEARTRVQEALDAALLYVARHPEFNTKPKQEEAALKFLESNLSGYAISIDDINILEHDGVYSASLDAHMPSTLLAAVGRKTLDVSTGSEVRLENFKFEIALALDVTGSMTGTKLDNLKTASSYVVTYLDSFFPTASDLKFALVPFATYVNVGRGNENAPWLDQNAMAPVNDDVFDLSGVKRLDLYDHLGLDWPGCVEARAMPYDVTDDPANAGTPETLFTPLFHPDEPDNPVVYPNTYLDDVDVTTEMSTIRDADKYGIASATPSSGWTAVSMTPDYTFFTDVFTPIGPGFNCPDRELIPLTSSRSTITNAIAALAAEGSTNMIEGVMWAWRALSSQAPFNEGGVESTTDLRKIIILLSDGNNHVTAMSGERGSSYYAYGYLQGGRMGLAPGATQSEIYDAMDARLILACDNAKAAGIEIFTIRLDLAGDTRSESVLKDCATTEAYHYLDVPDSADLEKAFKQISTEIISLYISK